MDEYVKRMYEQQEINRQIEETQRRRRENLELALWWQRFYAGMDAQREEMERNAREANARLDASTWEEPAAVDSPEPWTTEPVARHDDLIDAENRAGHLDRHDELLKLEVLSTYRQVDDHSHGRLNRLFMDEALATIAADDQHPLRKLLNEEGTDWLSRRADADVPTVNAGHMLSRQALREERFALEDSTYNQLSNHRGETQGYIFEKGDALDIEGVPVERRTAEMWERTKVIPEGTVANARPHRGWTNAEDA
jgi:hypothetical protein